MRDLIATSITLGLSIIANIITLLIQKSFNFISYWYIFVIIVLLAIFYDVIKILLDKDKSDLWRGRIAYLSLLINQSKVNEKKYIINDINGRINLARRELQFVNRLLPKLVQVEWIDSELARAETYDIKDGEFIVRVSNKNSQQKNIVDIVCAATRRTSLIGIRHIVSNNKPFEASIDEVISENVVLKINNRHIMDFFYKDHLQPCLDADKELAKYYAQAKVVDSLGLFFPIFLTELEYFSDRISGQIYRPFLLGEVEKFLEFLGQLTPEKTVIGVELQYEKAFLKTGILLIKSEKIMSVGVSPYLRMVDAYLDRQYHSFYLEYFETRARLNWRRFQSLVDSLVREIINHVTVEKDFDIHYMITDDEGIPREARCLRFIIHDKYALEQE